MIIPDHVRVVHDQHQWWPAFSSSGKRYLLHLVESALDIQKRSGIPGALYAEQAPNITKQSVSFFTCMQTGR